MDFRNRYDAATAQQLMQSLSWEDQQVLAAAGISTSQAQMLPPASSAANVEAWLDSTGSRNSNSGTIPVSSSTPTRKRKASSASAREKSVSPSTSSVMDPNSDSKRMQNRLAQREFRQRRQNYIATLEAQVADLTAAQNEFESKDTQLARMRSYLSSLEDENTRLRQALREVGKLIGEGVGGVLNEMSDDLKKDFAWKGKRVIKPTGPRRPSSSKSEQAHESDEREDEGDDDVDIKDVEIKRQKTYKTAPVNSPSADVKKASQPRGTIATVKTEDTGYYPTTSLSDVTFTFGQGQGQYIDCRAY